MAADYLVPLICELVYFEVESIHAGGGDTKLAEYVTIGFRLNSADVSPNGPGEFGDAVRRSALYAKME